MATINIGSIKFKWQGAYAGGTAYTVDDVVSYNGSSYICILASTGNLPTNATYWEQMSSAGTNGTDGTDLGTTLTTQGDIVYRDGSGLQRLAKGTAGQVLKINSGATAPEWGTDEGGKILQVQNMTSTGQTNTTSTTFVSTVLTDTITPSLTTSKILIIATGNLNNNGSTQWTYATIARDGTNLGSSVGMTGVYSAGGDIHVPCTMTYLDSPSSTSSLTYDVRISVSGNSGIWNEQNGVSSLTLIEIGA